MLDDLAEHMAALILFNAERLSGHRVTVDAIADLKRARDILNEMIERN